MNRQASIQVSVIIPFYNTAVPFFREAVASALEQTGVSLEILLVDDGSDQIVATVARQLAESSDGRIRYLAHPGGAHRGASATRNLGALQARGRYVAFLDSDDVWMPGKLEEQVGVLREMLRADMVFGLTEYWYDWKDPGATERRLIPDIGAKVMRTLEPPDFVSNFIRGKIIVPSASNFMARRKAYLACSGFEERFAGMYDDQAFYAKFGLESVVCVVPRCWDKYRQHPDSLTAHSRIISSEAEARRGFLLWLADYCRRHGFDQPELREAIAKALWLCSSDQKRGAGDLGRGMRRVKKWLLRFEEMLVPAHIRQQFWGRRKEP